MNHLLTICVTILLSSPLLAMAHERPASQVKLDVGDGIIATSEGRPGPLLLRHLRTDEDDLNDVAVRQLDVIYGRKFGMALTMDVYRPKKTPNNAGIIQIISGGLWSGPEYRRMDLYTRNIRALLDNGFTVFSVMHRSQPKFTLLEIRDDVPRAVRFVRHHADRFAIRPDQVGVVGFSSGGHLALLAGTTGVKGALNADDPVDAESSKVQAVVAYFPNADLLNYGADNKLMSDHFREQGLKMDSAYDFHKWDSRGCIFVPMTKQEIRTVFRETSPIIHVSQDDPPTLIFHGDKDQLVPIQQSREFERRMKLSGATCELVVADGEGHGWQKPLPGERKRVTRWFMDFLGRVSK